MVKLVKSFHSVPGANYFLEWLFEVLLLYCFLAIYYLLLVVLFGLLMVVKMLDFG